MTDRAVVAVLMATHDGAAFLDAQIDSILDQEGVDVRLVVSDDRSTDGTLALLERRAADDARIVLLPAGVHGSAHANFLRLVRDAPVDGADAIGFSDQDDVWTPGRLARQLAQLDRYDAVSGNVTAVFGSRRVRIDKAQPQRDFDFVLESAGPGSTFVLSASTFAFVRDVVDHDPEVVDAAIHDWLIYALVRASGRTWHIDSASLVDYRQHGANVRGANVGVREASARLGELRSGEFRRQAAHITRIAARVADDGRRDELLALAHLLGDGSPASRRALAARVPQLRRSARDRIALRALLLTGGW
ncbi:glycosyltransferase [Agrococcus jejuensis]|uniref:Rhamnosyltransferase n=1 Tax=Agrococcus jejuensis TaxID=399736 RepID=A0A1G8FHT1_9MICO|nr:glycosyltransferase [Agrococcus jejuensis]SDH81606.1 rhamnosyltransferase [Agrococcus jejuensis]